MLNSRWTVVVAATAVIAVAGSSGAVAGALIGSRDIRDNSVRTIDVRDGSLKFKDLNQRTRLKIRKKASKQALRALRLTVDDHQTQIDELRAELKRLGARIDATATLYVADGLHEMSILTTSPATPTRVADFTPPVFTQELVAGSGGFGANVILAVDVDGDGDAPDAAAVRAYHVGDATHAPNDPALLDGDALIAMDAVAPTRYRVDSATVNQWYATDASGGWAPYYGAWGPISTGRLANADVVSVMYTVGGSASWNDIAVEVSAGQ